MTKVLLTGGSGFIAGHILEKLLNKGYSVVTTVRSEEKAKKIRDGFPGKTKEQLDIAIVPDIAKADAFDEVVKTPGLTVVLHTASPFHFNIKDAKELVDPAVIGTTGILKSVARSAPGVKRVVITSSFAAILDSDTMLDSKTVYTEKSWNPVTREDAEKDAPTAYRASKTLAEKAAWEFLADKSNNAKFDIVTVNPPMVFGPVVPFLASLEAINTSNERLVKLLQGAWKDEVPATGLAMSWVDVRDVADAHVKAGLELPDAGGHRLFTAAGTFSNRDILATVRKNFPEYADKLPAEDVKGGELPEHRYKIDNSETVKILGVKWISLDQCVVDTVKSLKAIGA